jgi:hypothetical protein
VVQDPRNLGRLQEQADRYQDYARLERCEENLGGFNRVAPMNSDQVAPPQSLLEQPAGK